jgi:tRNA pseudouridine38-40 synthase
MTERKLQGRKNEKNQLVRYRLVVEFDGTNFSGWQKQNDARSVQGDLIKGCEQVFGSVLDLQGCGRTDSGVHGLNYVAHLETRQSQSLQGLVGRLNEALPKDLAVVAVEKAAPAFHARHNCIGRSYLYQLFTRKSAFGKRYGWWIQAPLNYQLMGEAASLMVGFHDFAAFAEKPELKKSTKVLVHAVNVFTHEGRVVVRVAGSHFLWHMVRRMVGLLVEVGCGRIPKEEITTLLQSGHGDVARFTAPAAGLFFEQGFYDEEQFRQFLREQSEGAKPLSQMLPLV